MHLQLENVLNILNLDGVGESLERLALQVRQVDHVMIDDAEPADAGAAST